MDSIIQQEKKCYICGSHNNLESHHIFGGSNKKWSEKFGLKIWMCHTCHNEPPAGAHHNSYMMDYLHKVGQLAFKEAYPDKDFRAIFGRNYL